MTEQNNGEAAITAEEERGLVKYETATHQEIKLSVKIVQDFFLPEATRTQALGFMGFCKASRLNPFLGECYLSVIEGKAQILVARDTLLKRAQRSPEYKGFRSGVVLLKSSDSAPSFEGEPEIVPTPFVAIEGLIYPPGYELVGGWCKVFRSDRDDPQKVTVPLSEYARYKKDGSIMKMWGEKPATMIVKTAEAHGHRKAFSDEVGGWYTADEFCADEQRHIKNVTPPKEALEEARQEEDFLVPAQFEMAFRQLGWTRGKLEMWWARHARGEALDVIRERLRAELQKAGKLPEDGAHASESRSGDGDVRLPVQGQAAQGVAAPHDVQPPPAEGAGGGVGSGETDLACHLGPDVDTSDPIVQRCLVALDWSEEVFRHWLGGQTWQTQEDVLLMLDVELDQRGIRLRAPTPKATSKKQGQLEIQ